MWQQQAVTVVDAYPGERASARDMHRLAGSYRAAAYGAAAQVQRGDPLTAAPLRLLALHAVELYLSAFLLRGGRPWLEIRRLGHDLEARMTLAMAAGLVLRRRTAAHVVVVARDREYLVARYGPDCLVYVSQVNRMLATLDEIGGKVTQAFEGAGSTAA